MQQFMGVAWGLAAAFIFSHSGSLFPLSHFLIVMDLFSVTYSFQRYWVIFLSRFMETKIRSFDEKECLISVRTYIAACF